MGEENNDDESFELRKLREMAKIASIYHTANHKFKRNPNLSHVVHACLNLFQFINNLGITIFHHLHHYIIRRLREKDSAIPAVPEEGNVLFLIYPICGIASILCGVIWLFTKIFIKRPEIPLVTCFASGILMLTMGVIEMWHVNVYIDFDLYTDAELLLHPIFIHNFAMCMLSLLCSVFYLVHGWVMFDYWQSVRKQRNIGEVYSDSEVPHSSSDHEVLDSQQKVSKRERKPTELPGELHPIPSLEKFPSMSSLEVEKIVLVEEMPVVLYCCCVDCFGYIKNKYFTQRPIHEFQVVHIM